MGKVAKVACRTHVTMGAPVSTVGTVSSPVFVKLSAPPMIASGPHPATIVVTRSPIVTPELSSFIGRCAMSTTLNSSTTPGGATTSCN